MRKLFMLLLAVILLAACQPSPNEGKPPAATPEPALPEGAVPVILEIRTSVVNVINGWTVEYALNGQSSTKYLDLMDVPEEAGVKTIWSQEYAAASGDRFSISFDGFHKAECVIVVNGEDVVNVKLDPNSEENSEAICEYSIP